VVPAAAMARVADPTVLQREVAPVTVNVLIDRGDRNSIVVGKNERCRAVFETALFFLRKGVK